MTEPQYKLIDDKVIQTPVSHKEFAIDTLLGLSSNPKTLPCKHIYDDAGSALFKRIMALPEYYLTRAETEILQKHRGSLFRYLSKGPLNLLELGAGDGSKTKILLNELIDRGHDFKYVPIDISRSAVETLLDQLGVEFPSLNTEGMICEYFNGLKWLSTRNGRTNAVLFLGSNIGNFSPEETNVFLTSLWNVLAHGDLVLIGFDLKKNVDRLVAAYNDKQGVSALFQMNLLERINRELGGEFKIDEFSYYSTYEPLEGAVRSHLLSTAKQTVRIEALGRKFDFGHLEAIHTETARKYSMDDIQQLATRYNFEIVETFFDDQRLFADSLWRVSKKA